MNSENFHEYVKNPSMLHQVSYQELKSLVLQYPYSPNLRYLLLLKSLLDQSKDFDRNQALASLSSPDRKKLRQLVKQYTKIQEIQENYALNEDFLELKDLSVLETLMEIPNVDDLEATSETPLSGAAAAPPPTTASVEGLMNDEEIEEESDLSFLNGLGSQQNDLGPAPLPDSAPDLDDLMENEASQLETDAATSTPAPDLTLEITNEQDVVLTPKPKSSFNSWLRKLNPPQAGLKADLRDISLNSKQLHQQEAEKVEVAKQIADHSVEEDEEIVSETLALLLEKQKFYGKAIAMYERLSLLFPEKSSLFAAKIEELNKKS